MNFFYKHDVWSTGDLVIEVNNAVYKTVNTSSISWSQESIYLAPGTHTVTWKYESFSSGRDQRLFIDAIRSYELGVDSSVFSAFASNGLLVNSISYPGTHYPYVLEGEVYDGEQVVLLGSEGVRTGEGAIELSVTAESDVYISFALRKNGGQGNFTFAVDGIDRHSSSETIDEWTVFGFAIDAGTHTLLWEHDKYYDDEDEVVSLALLETTALQNISEAISVMETDGVTVQGYQRDGNSQLPYVHPIETYNSTPVITLGVSAETGDNSLTLTVIVTEQTEISFAIKRTAANYSDIYFRLNGTSMLGYYGNHLDWSEYSFVLNPGTHTLEWENSKYYDAAYALVHLALLPSHRPPALETAYSHIEIPGLVVDSATTAGSYSPYVLSDDTHNGNPVLLLGVPLPSGENSFELSVTASEESRISFAIKKNDFGGTFLFHANSELVLSNYSQIDDWAIYDHVLQAGTHTLKWSHEKYYDDRDDFSRLVFLPSETVPINEAFSHMVSAGLSINSISRTGTPVPFIHREETHGGEEAVQLGVPRRSGENELELNVTAASDCTISFALKKPHHSDTMYFSINSTTMLTQTASLPDWTVYEFPLSAGTHRLIWRNDKFYDYSSHFSYLSVLPTVLP